MITVGTFLFVVVLPLYLIPTIVAQSRHHHQATAILMLNLLLGWTLLGWVAALVWAFTAVRSNHIYIERHRP